jgi:hemolysin III
VRPEELPNVITHGVGAVASVAGAAVLVVMAALGRDPWQIVGTALFGASLILLYTASTLYHASSDETVRRRLKIFDHTAIYILIAGTYTPFLLDALRGGWGWAMFGVIWGLAIAGVTFKLFFTGRFRLFSTLVYLLMGWLVLIAIVPLVRALPPVTLVWLAAGGLAYTAGTPFYHSTRIRHAHAVWHMFVLAGSACHAVAVWSQL